MAQLVKNPPTVRETWVQSLGWEDPLEKGMATYSSILVWRIPWTEGPGRLQSTGAHRVGDNLATKQQQHRGSGNKEGVWNFCGVNQVAVVSRTDSQIENKLTESG